VIETARAGEFSARLLSWRDDAGLDMAQRAACDRYSEAHQASGLRQRVTASYNAAVVDGTRAPAHAIERMSGRQRAAWADWASARAAIPERLRLLADAALLDDAEPRNLAALVAAIDMLVAHYRAPRRRPR
jgi:hypothetical protein